MKGEPCHVDEVRWRKMLVHSSAILFFCSLRGVVADDKLQRAFSRAKGELRATQMKTRVNSLMIHVERKREKENERCVKRRTYP